MKIYVAGSDIERANVVANELKAMGHEITSRWLQSKDFRQPRPDERNKEIALSDLDDVNAADCIVSLSCAPGKGGRHVEVGYALAQGKRVFVLGERENVFHYHPLVKQVACVKEVEA